MPRSEMRVGQLDKMALEELLELREQADKLIQQKITGEKFALQQKLARIEQFERHRRAAEPFAKLQNPERHARRRAPAKYRDPLSGATWSGRGKLPRWMVTQIEQGAKREDFKISIDP